jgi:acyl-coenzyme A thioesterase 9
VSRCCGFLLLFVGFFGRCNVAKLFPVIQQSRRPQSCVFKRLLVTEAVQQQQQQQCPTPQRILPPKSPKDSFIQKTLRFSTDKRLRDCYINHFGHLRVGLILEDLDRMAGAIAYKHVLGEKEIVVSLLASDGTYYSPSEILPKTESGNHLIIVTASCERIDIFKLISSYHDLVLQGNVVAVGRSSMEIVITVDSLTPEPERVVVAKVTMVARENDKPYQNINPVIPTTPEEILLFQEANESRERRKRRAQEALTISPPTQEEYLLIHKLFTERKHNPSFIDMSATSYQSLVVMHPQKQNIYGKVFGGYLMRVAYEQAWATAYLFSGKAPHFRAVDDINFFAPVDIGTVCTFNSKVVFTTENTIQVTVQTDVVNPERKTTNTTNTFHFTFVVDSKTPIPQVTFSKYEDAMQYLSGKRRYELGKKLEEKRMQTNKI